MRIVLVFIFAAGSLFANSLDLDLSQVTACVKSGFKLSDINAPQERLKDCRSHTGFPLIIEKIVPQKDVGIREATVIYYFDAISIAKEGLALNLPAIGENWQIYINGKLVAKAWPQVQGFKRQTLKGVVVALTGLKKNGNQLLFRLKGTPFQYNIIANDNIGFYMSHGYGIGSSIKLENDRFDKLSLMLIGIFLFFGIYHVFIFFFGDRREPSKLFFGIFSSFLSCYLFLISNVAYELLSEIDTLFIQVVEFTILYTLLPFFLTFLIFHFEQKFTVLQKVIFFTSALFIVVSLVGGFEIVKIVLRTWQWFMLPCLAYLLYYIVFLSLKVPRAWVMAIGIGLAIATALFDILASALRFSNLRFFTFAFFVFIFVIVLDIAYRLFSSIKETAKLNAQLEHQNKSMSKFIPMQVLDQLEVKTPGDLKIGDNVLRFMSILFSDIRRFTTLSETMGPDENFRFLNSYLQRMEPQIHKHGGYVDKFIGDAIMALFSEREVYLTEGPTLSTSDRAVDASLGMFSELAEYNLHRDKQGYQPIDIGIGIHTGPLILGAIGSKNRIDTTVIGNTVNEAARIEGLTSRFNSKIIISEYAYLELANPEKYMVRELGAIKVAGKQEPLVVYEIFNCDAEEIIELKQKTLGFIAQGLSHYRIAKFQAASSEFAKALHEFADDKVAKVYMNLCAQASKRQINTDTWQGIIQVAQK